LAVAMLAIGAAQLLALPLRDEPWPVCAAALALLLLGGGSVLALFVVRNVRRGVASDEKSARASTADWLTAAALAAVACDARRRGALHLLRAGDPRAGLQTDRVPRGGPLSRASPRRSARLALHARRRSRPGCRLGHHGARARPRPVELARAGARRRRGERIFSHRDRARRFALVDRPAPGRLAAAAARAGRAAPG